MGSVSSAIANAARESGAHIVTSAEVYLVQLILCFLRHLLQVKTNNIHLKKKRKVAIFGWITDCLSLNCLPFNMRFGIILDANSAEVNS